MEKANKIIVLGGGESGVGAAVLAVAKGFDVFVSDKGAIKQNYKDKLIQCNIAFEEGKHSYDLFANAIEVIKSPGIPNHAEAVKYFRDKNIPVVSEIEFAARYTHAKKICITGTNGKTTTTMLTYHILQKAGYNVGLAGNVGTSLALQVAENNFDYYVIELSSFQLDDMFDFKADIAVMLNITPDHLDRYEYSLQKYIDSKFRILQNMTADGAFVYCDDDATIKQQLIRKLPPCNLYPFSLKRSENVNAWVEDEKLHVTIKSKQLIMSIFEIAIHGKHNLYNSMAASIPAFLLDIKDETIRESLMDFQNIEHRLEFVNSVNGVDYINDSKATNVNSAWYALESMNKPIVWIAGGQDKGNDYAILEELVKDKVKAIVCLGTDNKKIIKAFGKYVDIIVETASAEEAVRQANHISKKGDVVLLSPACASFDLFKNYEERGRLFKAAVKSL
ncbi:MAG: UDP-N-acetylmuramoyl-L-alanine--D-glutamate ligase [Bacteroidetes bacterium]|nr:UDP-N-acetylmuramoyl-L-alanine--D-glutamate ligase [Bacteroidota bacterium]